VVSTVLDRCEQSGENPSVRTVSRQSLGLTWAWPIDGVYGTFAMAYHETSAITCRLVSRYLHSSQFPPYRRTALFLYSTSWTESAGICIRSQQLTVHSCTLTSVCEHAYTCLHVSISLSGCQLLHLTSTHAKYLKHETTNEQVGTQNCC
jgi:hypothetical protein